jgi:SAM-dependent methyltransferase
VNVFIRSIHSFWWRAVVRARYLSAGIAARERFPRFCNICGHEGYFGPASKGTQRDAKCPRCGSAMRDRLVKLWLDANGDRIRTADLLHFAPERSLAALIKPLAKSYISADLAKGRAEKQIDIENMAFDERSFDVVLCSHVLEHVDDQKALKEIHRVLRPGGYALIMLPLVEGWARTYEDAAISAPEERALHFGQHDHVRYYGSDVRERIKSAGFELVEFTPDGHEVARYGLLAGEKLFIARRQL